MLLSLHTLALPLELQQLTAMRLSLSLLGD
jgi:hypothetical protein